MTMTAGSIAGTLTGAPLLGVIPNLILVAGLALFLVICAAKLWRHQQCGQLAPSRRAQGLTEPLGSVDLDHGVVMTVLWHGGQ
jgi:uncharacterized membrane protein YfcA